MGRPTKYREEYAEQVEGLCKLGATIPEIAEFFSVAPSTISKWLDEIPAFSEAIKAGRIVADQRVAEALYKQALDGNTTAQIFWLKNRRKEQWRDRHDYTVERRDSLAELTDDDLEAIASGRGGRATVTAEGPAGSDSVH